LYKFKHKTPTYSSILNQRKIQRKKNTKKEKYKERKIQRKKEKKRKENTNFLYE